MSLANIGDLSLQALLCPVFCVLFIEAHLSRWSIDDSPIPALCRSHHAHAALINTEMSECRAKIP